MHRSRSIRAFMIVGAVAGSFGVAACIDLFHSTDLETLCEHDPGACAPDVVTIDGGDTAVDASPDVDMTVDVCASSSDKALDTARRACGWLGACFGALDDSRFGSCMMHALAAYDCSFNPVLRPRRDLSAQWDCLSKVTDCASTQACIYGTRPGTRCTPGTGGTYTACDPAEHGIVVAECGNSVVPLGIQACTLQGRTCARVDESTSLCAGTRGADCKTAPRCDGTFAVACQSTGGIDADQGRDCATVGDGRCVSDSDGVACAPADAAGCTHATSSKVVCVDTTVAESCVDGKAVTIHCGAIGRACNATGASSVEPWTACSNGADAASCDSEQDECNGDVLVSCVRGMAFELSCSDVGLGGCKRAAARQAACSAP